MQYLGIPPTQAYSNGISSGNKPTSYGSPQVSIQNGQVIVPDLRGYSLRQSANALAPHGVYLVPSGSGRIVRQDPAPGTTIHKGDEIQVYLAPQELPPSVPAKGNLPEKPKDVAIVPTAGTKPKEAGQ